MHDPVNHPDHYTQGSIECIDYIEAQRLGFHEAQVVKYITRWRMKNGLEDLMKAEWYLKRLIGTLKATTRLEKQPLCNCEDGAELQCCEHPERGICAPRVNVDEDWLPAACAVPFGIDALHPPTPNDTESYCLGDFHRIADWMKKAWINE